MTDREKFYEIAHNNEVKLWRKTKKQLVELGQSISLWDKKMESFLLRCSKLDLIIQLKFELVERNVKI